MRKLIPAFVPAVLAAAPVAFAAPPPAPAHMHAPTTAKGAKVDAATMHKFAKAYEDVMQVRASYIGKLKSANGSQKKTALKQQATHEMKQHISHYMPVSQYIKVGKEINASQALRQRLMAILRQDRGAAKASSPSTGS